MSFNRQPAAACTKHVTSGYRNGRLSPHRSGVVYPPLRATGCVRWVRRLDASTVQRGVGYMSPEVPFQWEISGTPSNIRFPGPLPVHIPNGISIDSSAFAQFTSVPNTGRQNTDHGTCDTCSNRPHLCDASDAG